MGNCSSSPVDGCSSSQTILKLSEFTADVELKLGQLIVKKGQIVVDIKACNENNNNLFEEIIDKFTEFKNNSAECCEALQDALDDIIDELDDITGGTTVTTEEPSPTTTEEPTPTTTEEETPTTTEEPTTTTTEGPQYKSGLFNYEDNHKLLCIGENEITLFYEGVIEEGTTLYVVAGITPFIAADYIKRAEGVVKYHLDGFGTIDQQLVDTCE